MRQLILIASRYYEPLLRLDESEPTREDMCTAASRGSSTSTLPPNPTPATRGSIGVIAQGAGWDREDALNMGKLSAAHFVQLTTLTHPRGSQVLGERREVGKGACMAGCRLLPTPPGTAGVEGEPTRIGNRLVCMCTHLFLYLG